MAEAALYRSPVQVKRSVRCHVRRDFWEEERPIRCLHQQRHHVLSKEAIMDDAGAKVIDLIFGRWRSQILYTGVKLGVFDALASGPKNAVKVAHELDVDAGMLYRLMRALGSLELLKEDNSRTFSLAPMGEWLCRDHPHSLRGMTLLEEGPEGLCDLATPACADHRRAAKRLCPGVWSARFRACSPERQLWGRSQ